MLTNISQWVTVHFNNESQSPHGSVVERITSNDEVVSSILAVGKLLCFLRIFSFLFFLTFAVVLPLVVLSFSLPIRNLFFLLRYNLSASARYFAFKNASDIRCYQHRREKTLDVFFHI